MKEYAEVYLFSGYLFLYNLRQKRKEKSMKNNIFFKETVEESIRLSENQVISVKGKQIQINCLYGTLWITMPGGIEKIVKKGETVSLSLKGKICIVAFSESSVQIQRKEWRWFTLFSWIRKNPVVTPSLDSDLCRLS